MTGQQCGLIGAGGNATWEASLELVLGGKCIAGEAVLAGHLSCPPRLHGQDMVQLPDSEWVS